MVWPFDRLTPRSSSQPAISATLEGHVSMSICPNQSALHQTPMLRTSQCVRGIFTVCNFLVRCLICQILKCVSVAIRSFQGFGVSLSPNSLATWRKGMVSRCLKTCCKEKAKEISGHQPVATLHIFHHLSCILSYISTMMISSFYIIYDWIVIFLVTNLIGIILYSYIYIYMVYWDNIYISIYTQYMVYLYGIFIW